MWALDGIPPGLKEELLPPKLKTLIPHLERLTERMPLVAKAGIRVVNNGPMCFTPDGLLLIGPVPNMDGLWLATGFNVGIGTGGGSAEILAKWITSENAPLGLDAIHAGWFGKTLSKEAALASIRNVYTRGYQLPENI